MPYIWMGYPQCPIIIVLICPIIIVFLIIWDILICPTNVLSFGMGYPQ